MLLEELEGRVLLSAPAAPSDLTAVALSDTEIALGWADNSIDENGFRVEVSFDGSTFDSLADLDADSITYTSAALPNHAHFFRVMAYNDDGESAWSNTASAITYPPVADDFTVTPTSTSQVELTWSAVTGLTGQTLEREEGQSGNWISIPVGAQANSYTDTNLMEGTELSYRLKTSNSTGDSEYTDVITTHTWPAAPGGLNALALSDTTLELSWTDNSHGESGYIIEDRTFGGDWRELATVIPDTTSIETPELVGGLDYDFRVRAWNDGGESDNSNVVTAKPLILPAPTDLLALQTYSDRIVLHWKDNADDELGFTVEASTDGINYTSVGSAPADADGTTISGLAIGTSYSLRVRAYNATMVSEWVTLGASTDSIVEPSRVTAQYNDGDQSVTALVTWTDNSDNETQFLVWAASPYSETGFDLMFIADADAQSALIPGFAPGKAYMLYVQANDPDLPASSGPSEMITFTTPLSGDPAVPTNLTVTGTSYTQVDLSWTDNSNNEDEFGVSGRPRDFDPIYGRGAAVLANITTASVTDLSPGIYYDFFVEAYTDTRLASGASNEVEVQTPLAPAPSGLTATAVYGDIQLQWTNNYADADGIEVQRSKNGGSFRTIYSPLAPTDTTYTDTPPDATAVYTYRVRALKGIGYSAWSNENSARRNDTISVVATTPQVAEGGSDPGQFTVYRDGDNYNTSLTVYYTVEVGDSEATPGDDYTPLSGSVTIASGEHKATIDVNTLLDEDDTEATEPVTITLAANPAYALAAEPQTRAAVNILNKKAYLVAFYGLDIHDPTGPEPTFGNFYLRQIIDDVSQAKGYTKILKSHKDILKAKKAFLDAINADPQDRRGRNRISKAEAESVTLRVAGYSLGGVEAINLTRDFANLTRVIEGYRLDVEIPVEKLVTIDPVNNRPESLTTTSGSVKTNVKAFVNWYQDKGGNSTMRGIDENGNLTSDFDTLGTALSRTIHGSSIESLAPKTETRVDTQLGNEKVEKAYFFPKPDPGHWGTARLYGNDVNHDTITWWLYDKAVQELS